MKISVITVCFNSARFIAQAIQSVLSQDHPNFELVIVDGGSTDGTVELIRRYAERDRRIIWRSEPDQGISDAMNKGVSMASGEVISHLNSDDYYPHAGVLSRVDAVLNSHSETPWLTGGLTFVAEDGGVLREMRPRRYSFRRLLRGNILLHPATFIRRHAFLDVGAFNLALQYCMDYDLFLRLGRLAPPLILDESLACFRAHPGSRSIVFSEQAYAEEFKVRVNHLRETGRMVWPYQLDYQIKRRFNKLINRRLLDNSRSDTARGNSCPK